MVRAFLFLFPSLIGELYYFVDFLCVLLVHIAHLCLFYLYYLMATILLNVHILGSLLRKLVHLPISHLSIH